MQRDSPYQQKLLNLQGYGVEIALKNMEYKQTDSESQPESFGIDFEKLKKKFSHLSSDLDTFRDHMQKETPKSQKELKVWEMSNFGLQAAYTIVRLIFIN
jgi:UDP-glucose:glycoprotein glucosyltransferase